MAAISSVVPFGSPNTEQYLNNDTGVRVCVYIFYLRAEKREISLMFYYAKIEREKKRHTTLNNLSIHIDQVYAPDQ